MTSVLVVDDSRTVRRVVERTLTAAGYAVALAADGDEALAECAREKPDLLLVDVVMPRLGGLELCLRLRDDARLAAIPVILMTARSDGDLDHLVHDSGAADAITKPFGPEALRAVTARVLARSMGSVRPLAASQAPPRPSTPSARPHSFTAAEHVAATLGDVVRRFTGTGTPTNLQLTSELLRALPGDALERLASKVLAGSLGVAEGAALVGNVERVPLASILELAEHSRLSGVLTVVNATRRATVCFRQGMTDIALGDGGEPEFRLGRYLLEQSLIDETLLERYVAAPSRGLWLGARLTADGVISTNALQEALVRQSSEVLYDALRWKKGNYFFHEGETRREAEDAKLGLPIAFILMEGLRRVDEWRFIEERIRSFDVIFVPKTDTTKLLAAGVLTPEERVVLVALDGRRTVRDVVEETSMSSFDACKVLFRLVTAGLAREA
jgi:DNA-binding response OmpR family regulator